MVPLSDRDRIIAMRGFDLRKYALVAPDFSFVYVSIPKAANTTVKRLLWRLRGVEVAEEAAQKVLHLGPGPYLGLHDLSRRRLSLVLRSPETFRFTVVRNPYTRLRSAYRQKFLRPHPGEDYANRIGWRATEPPSFGEFIDRIARQSPLEMDPHWAPQHRSAFIGLVRYDRIARVESFEDDMGSVLERLNAQPGLLRGERLNETEGGGEHIRYTRDLADKVFDIYRRDFDLFGYGRDSHDF